MGGIEPGHWVVVLIVAGLLFGGYKKLPEMARSAGRSMRVFKTELKGLEDDDQARANAAQPTAYAPPAAPVQPGVAPVQPVASEYAPPAQYAPPAAPPAPSTPPAPAVIAAPAAVDQPAITAETAYVPTAPAADPTAPPRG